MGRFKNTVLLLGRKNSGTRNWGLKYIATPPGETIKEQLSDKGMNLKDFADKMNMPEESISKLISGEVRLTPEIAVKLEKALGVPAGFWNNLEAIYRERIVKAEAEDSKARRR